MLTSPLCTHKYPHWIVEYSKPVNNVTGNNGLMSEALRLLVLIGVRKGIALVVMCVRMVIMAR